MNFIKKLMTAMKPISKEEMNKLYYSRANYIYDLEARLNKMEKQIFN